MYKMTVSYTGINLDLVPKMIETGMSKAIKRLVDIGRDEAQKVYLEKRKTDALPSMVIASFVTFVGFGGNKEVVGYVECGGPSAPHAIYLEEDHTLRNGVMWSAVNPKAPYAFMKAGFDKAVKEAPGVLAKELKL